MKIEYPKNCVCCKMGVIEEVYQTCEICGWIDDPNQNENPESRDGRNDKTFQEYREEFIASYGMCFCAE